MKKRHIPALLLLSASLCNPLIADEYTYEEIPYSENAALKVEKPKDIPNFWQIKARYDISANADINTPEFKGEHLRYGEGEASATYVYHLNCDTVLTLGAGWGNTLVQWKENPFFKKESYNNAFVTIGALSTAVKDWTWQGEFSLNSDTDRFFDQSVLYTFAGWGRYSCNPNSTFGTSVGCILRSGIRQDIMWPVFGFDWQLKNWSINLIYPVNVSVVYRFTKCWSAGVAARFINSRHRLEKDEPDPSGIFEYRNFGLEAGLSYECAPFFSANVHIGVLDEGDLKVTNSRYRDATYCKTKAAGYAGASILVRF